MSPLWLMLLVAYAVMSPVNSKNAFSTYTSICNAKDPDLSNCVLKAAQDIMPQLSKGIKEYGLTPIDPLIIPRMVVGQDTGPVTIQFILTNSTQTGLGSTRWQSANIDIKRGRWELNGTVDDFHVSGHYETKGKILVLPIVGEGHATFDLFNLSVGLIIEGQPVKTKNNLYFKFSKFLLDFNKLDKSQANLTNLFKGNKALGDQMNKFLNENDLEIFRHMRRSLVDVYSALFKAILQRMLDTIPYNQLFKGI